MKTDKEKIADFLFEISTMRKIPRAHQHVLLTQDLSDNIASHSHRVAIIAWFLAKMEKVDPYKTTMMALLHDAKETRSGDHHYIHKKYIKIFEDEISRDQLSDLPFKDFFNFIQEFEKRESPESLVAKDADLIDQIILLKEYSHQGNKEAKIWLDGKGGENGNHQYRNLKTDSGKKIVEQVLRGKVSGWWENIWTSKNR